MKLTNYAQFHEDLKSRGIEYAAEHTVEMGFDSVEFLGLTKAAQDTSRTARTLKGLGLTVSCFSEGINLLDTSKRTREEMEIHLFRCADIAAELGSPFLHHTLVLPLSLPMNAPPLADIFESIVNSAEKVANYCEKLGIVCLYEPQGMYFNGCGLELFYDEMKKRCGNIGICGDVGNSLFVDHSPNLVFDRFASDIKHVHLKDYYVIDSPRDGVKNYKTLGGKYLSDSELGVGAVDIPYCMNKLKEVGYAGAYSFEIICGDEEMKNAVRYFEKVIGK
ncbi:MAG: sugar phosphate isomerase/epimerase [Ruminococcaceae bacterium]|nr:sugar phosphate isomerase/epimerase [Oscillospiraceae bacterium]